jgi:hypothetical protein
LSRRRWQADHGSSSEEHARQASSKDERWVSPPLKPHALNAPWQFNPAATVVRQVRIRHSAKHPQLNAPLLHRPGIVRFSIPEFDRVRLAGPAAGRRCVWRMGFERRGVWTACLLGAALRGDPSSLVRRNSRDRRDRRLHCQPTSPLRSNLKALNAPWQFNPATFAVGLLAISFRASRRANFHGPGVQVILRQVAHPACHPRNA